MLNTDHTDPAVLRELITTELSAARERTTRLTDCMDEHDLIAQHSPLMSPLVWDLAHIGNQEELWLLRTVGGRDPMHPEIDPLYDAFRHPRTERHGLPLLPPKEARIYTREVRGRILELLDAGPLEGTPLLEAGFVYGMIAQHEQQHDETMLITHQLRKGPAALSAPPPSAPTDRLPSEVLIPSGPFTMGTDTEPWALGCQPRPSGRRPPGTIPPPAAPGATRGATRPPPPSTPTSASAIFSRPGWAVIPTVNRLTE